MKLFIYTNHYNENSIIININNTNKSFWKCYCYFDIKIFIRKTNILCFKVFYLICLCFILYIIQTQWYCWKIDSHLSLVLNLILHRHNHTNHWCISEHNLLYTNQLYTDVLICWLHQMAHRLHILWKTAL